MNSKALFNLCNEFAPVLAFFLAAQFFSFYTATAVLIASTFVSLLGGWYFMKSIPVLPFISGFFVIVSGFITIKHQIPNALIFADSLYYFMMGIALSVGLAFQINILKQIFDKTFALTNTGWLILTRRWIIIFFLAAIANEIARHQLTPEGWVNFKVAKVVMITLIGTYQFTLAKQYRIVELTNKWGLRNSE